MSAAIQAQIAAHRERLAMLRAQRPYRDFSRKVVNLSAWKPSVLLTPADDTLNLLARAVGKQQQRRFSGAAITALGGFCDCA